MNRTALDIPDVGKASGRYESEEDRQAIDESTCRTQEASQLLLKKQQAIARHEEDVGKSEIERGIVGLNALAPIKRLSNDDLCHIFELHCKDSLVATFPRDQCWRLVPPQVTLSHVCSAWREIMLEVPTFWRSIRFVPKGRHKRQTFVAAVKAANTWLSRAKGLPCSFAIDFPENNRYWEDYSEDDDHWNGRSLWASDWHKNIIRDFISLHKFKKLGVIFADHHLRELLQLPDDKLSCVEELCLRHISPLTPFRRDEDDTPFDLHKLSNLTSFSLLPNPFDTYSPCSPSEGYFKFSGIPWCNLRHIHIRATIPAPFCLDILEHCSAVLKTCFLFITADDTFTSSPASPRVPVYLSQLRELKVAACSLTREEEILESFLLLLRFPNLNSLTLGSSDHPIYLGTLLQMTDARSLAGDRDSKHWIEVIGLKSVTLYCSESEDGMEDEGLDFIEEIELSGVELNVVYYSSDSDSQ